MATTCLVYLFLRVVFAAAESTGSTLPEPLSSLVPPCGQLCVTTFISNTWPSNVCGSSNLGCLCTSGSGNGLTIGEGALQCVASTCTGAFALDQSTRGEIYGVCAGIQGALPNTHRTLTATPVKVRTKTVVASYSPTKGVLGQNVSSGSGSESSKSTSKTRYTDSSSRPSHSISTHSSSHTLASTHSSSHTLASSSPTTSVESTFTPTPSATVLPAAASSQTPSTTRLSSGQIAGIAVSAVVVMILLVGLALCVGLLRRRKKRLERDSNFLGMDVEPEKPPPSPSPLPYPVAPMAEKPTRHGSPRKDRNSPLPPPPALDLLPPEPGPPPAHEAYSPEEIGLAISHDSRSLPYTPQTSNAPLPRRSSSRLLPEKPTFLPPTLATPRAIYVRPVSDATYIDIDEDDDRASLYSRPGLGVVPARRSSSLERRLARNSSGRRSRPAPPVPPPIPPPGPRSQYLPIDGSGNGSGSFSSGSSGAHDARLSALLRLYSGRDASTRSSRASETSFESDADDRDERGNAGSGLPALREMSNESDNDGDGKDTSPISPQRLNYPSIPRPLSFEKKKRKQLAQRPVYRLTPETKWRGNAPRSGQAQNQHIHPAFRPPHVWYDSIRPPQQARWYHDR